MPNPDAIAIMAAIIYAHDPTVDPKLVAEQALALSSEVETAVTKSQQKAGQQSGPQSPKSPETPQPSAQKTSN